MVSSKRRNVARIASVLAILSSALPASAQDASSGHAAAVASFEEGAQLETRGDCTAAIVKFKESLALEPGVGARIDLADCEERLGAAEAAWRDFRLAERLAIARKDERATIAHVRAESLEHKLQLILVPQVAGISIILDGNPVEPELFAQGWLAVAPTGHGIKVSAPGREPLVLAIPPEDAPARSVTLPPLAELRVTTQPAPRAISGGGGASVQRTLGVVLGAVGVLGVAIGTVAGVRTLAEQRDAVNACGGTYPRCSLSSESAVTSANDGAQTSGTVSTTAFVAGGLALGGGALLFLTAPRAEKSPRGTLRIVPTLGTNQEGASLAGQW
jgi:hypothetical protein